MECAKCGEYFIGTSVSLKCYDILYNEKKELEQENRELQISCDGFIEQCSKLEAKIHNMEEENAKLKRDKKDQCIMYDDLHKKYTKVLDRMTKAEAKVLNIEEWIRRLTSLIIDEY